jgi:hypothetical protein
MQPEQYADRRRTSKVNDSKYFVEAIAEAWHRSNTHYSKARKGLVVFRRVNAEYSISTHC